MKTIDLRSDTVTQPTSPMLQFMLNSPLGDDVYGEDPSVNQLQDLMAKMSGKEATLFCPSGTQSNLLASMSHCERGDEYIVGSTAHMFLWEGGGAGVLGSVWPSPIDFENDGTLKLSLVEEKIKPLDDHFARTKLLCLENTINGKVLPLQYLKEVRQFCNDKKLLLHLDGARVFNAAVELQIPLSEITQYFDSISICLSKGLGAPVGSLLCGSKDFILKAKRWRKILGGGMRQAGILAGAGIYALENNIQRLKDDHQNARFLAEGLTKIEHILLADKSLNTNMLFLRFEKNYSDLQNWLKERGIIFPVAPNKSGLVRLVTHLNISQEDIDYIIEQVSSFYLH